MRVLLIEDDELLGDGLVAGLQLNGFDVEWMRDGCSAAATLAAESFDLLVLDLGLPRMDGLDVLKEVRQAAVTLPCLIITARDAVGDRVAGLDAGADDYLCKPFALDELAARLRALYRRPATAPQAVLARGDLVLDPVAHTLSVAGEAVALPRREFALLECLLRGQGQVFSRSQLESRVYGWGEEVSSNAIEVHVHALRQRLGRELITTVRGSGYTIEPLP